MSLDIDYVLCNDCALVAWIDGELDLDEIVDRIPVQRSCDRCGADDAIHYHVHALIPTAAARAA